jgi:hypothetical protein
MIGTERVSSMNIGTTRPPEVMRTSGLSSTRLAAYVRPYSKGQKNDFRDAEAIAEAVQRPTMRFVATKTVEQLDLQALRRVRGAGRSAWRGSRSQRAPSRARGRQSRFQGLLSQHCVSQHCVPVLPHWRAWRHAAIDDPPADIDFTSSNNEVCSAAQ